MTARTQTESRTPTIKLNNGVALPALGLGVFQSPPPETVGAVEAALPPFDPPRVVATGEVSASRTELSPAGLLRLTSSRLISD